MIRRCFLRFVALSPLGGLVAWHQSAAADYPWRELTERMVQIQALRKLIDAGDHELKTIQADFKGIPPSDPRFSECIAKCNPIYMRLVAREDRLRELERKPLDCLFGDPGGRIGEAMFAISNEIHVQHDPANRGAA